jgi:hypothetical protein
LRRRQGAGMAATGDQPPARDGELAAEAGAECRKT